MDDRGRDDRALVRRVLAGDADAGDELMRRLRPLAIGMARARFGLDPHAAEEVWQDVVVRLWSHDLRALRAWRGEGKLTTYLAVIVTRLCLKRRARRARSADATLDERTLDERPTEPAGDPHDAAEIDERRRAVASALRELSARDRLVLLLRYDDERPPREIARLLGLKPATARKALHDALKRLRRQVRRQRPELFGRDAARRTSEREVTNQALGDLIARRGRR